MRQVNNSLSAEIELAAAATIVRDVNGGVLTDQQVMPAAIRFLSFDRYRWGFVDRFPLSGYQWQSGYQGQIAPLVRAM